MTNPTIKTQLKIIEILESDIEGYFSISYICSKASLSLGQVKSSVIFLESLGVVKTVTSSGGTTLVSKNGDS